MSWGKGLFVEMFGGSKRRPKFTDKLVILFEPPNISTNKPLPRLNN